MLQNTWVNNTVNLRGIIDSPFTFSHKVYDEGFYTFYVSVSRLSEVFDRLPITISERLVKLDKLQVGANVYIEGQLRSYNSYDTEYKRNKLILTVFTKDLVILDAQRTLDEAADEAVEGAEDEAMSEAMDEAMDEGTENLQDSLFLHNKTPNEIILNGYICKPPVFRTTPFGREITDILLAVNRSYNKSDYIPCIAWGRNARYISDMAVGDNIKIFGRMQSRIYQKRLENGETIEKTAYEVSVSKVEIEPKPSEESEVGRTEEQLFSETSETEA